jgi:acyl-CoA synthetase (NDP forming)/RimJ/RimL family protein N-acetyltransferase
MSVRPIRPDDAERIVAFHDRQSPESIYFRFFSPRPRLSERDVERFTHVDYVDRMAFVGLLGDELIGVARYDRHRGRSDAEVAFFIDDEHHGRGMATVLLEYLAVAAREAGISGFTATVLPQNRKMLSVFTQAGFTAHSHFEDGVIEVELGIEPTPEALAAIDKRAGTAEARSVARILAPSSIAVVGASRATGTIGHQTFANLVAGGFEGPVYPINPEASYVASVRAWRSVLDVPGELDLAVICVPADQVLRVVEECAVKRVQGLIVLSAGFAEAGEAGEALETELVGYARRHGMRLVGPNALGVINLDPMVRMHATFVPIAPLPGRVGLMAQSGVIGAAILEGARAVGLGISSFVSVGNKADVSGNDLLRYWQDDPATDVAMLYLESFGNPSKFSRIARTLSRVKPIVAVKISTSGSDAWEGEADSVAAGDTVAALLEQAGVVRVDNLTQMLHTAGVLANQPLPAGNRVAVLTNSWGPSYLAADALRARGLDPVEPIHLPNDADPARFTEALASLYANPDVDSVLVVYAPGLRTHYKRVAAAIRDAACRPDAITTVGCLLGHQGVGTLADARVTVPEFPFPEEAALALGRVTAYAAWRATPVGEVFEPDEAKIASARTRVDAVLADDAADPSGAEPRFLDADLTAALLDAVGLATIHQEVVDDAEAAVAAANRIGYPVAIKAGGLDQLTKTEAGGVSLDVHGDDEVRDACRRMTDVLGAAMHPTIVQEMVREGVECRIAVARHRVIGDVVTLGVGGALAERVGDRAVRLFPVSDRDADLLIDASPVGALLDEQGPASREAVRDLVHRLSALADAVPEIVTLRLNPVMVVDGIAAITDVRIAVAPHQPDTRPTVRRL